MKRSASAFNVDNDVRGTSIAIHMVDEENSSVTDYSISDFESLSENEDKTNFRRLLEDRIANFGPLAKDKDSPEERRVSNKQHSSGRFNQWLPHQFVLFSLIIACALLFELWKMSDRSAPTVLRIVCHSIAFIMIVRESFFIGVKIKGFTEADVYRGVSRFILNYKPAIEAFNISILVSYFISVISETILRCDSFIVEDTKNCFGSIIAIIIVLISAYFLSVRPQSVSFRLCAYYLMELIILMNKVQSNSYFCELVAYSHSGVSWFMEKIVYSAVFDVLGNLEAGCMLVKLTCQCVLFCFFSTVIKLFGLPVIAGQIIDHSRHLLIGWIWVCCLQYVSVFISPFLAFFLSVPSISHLNDAELHVFFTTLITNPVINILTDLRLFLTHRVVAILIVTTLPAVNVICALSWPNSHSSMIFVYHDGEKKVVEGKMVGTRIFMTYIGKIVSCIHVVSLCVTTLVRYGFLLVSNIAIHLFLVSPDNFYPEFVVGGIALPLIQALSMAECTRYQIAEMFGYSFIRELQVQSSFKKVMNFLITNQCLMKFNSSYVEYKGLSDMYTFKKIFQTDDVKLGKAHSINDTIYLVAILTLRNCNISLIAVFYMLFATICPNMRWRIAQILPRSMLSSLFSIVLVTSVANIFKDRYRRMVCKFPEAMEAISCNAIIHKVVTEGLPEANICTVMGGILTDAVSNH